MGAVLQFNEGASAKHLQMEKAVISHGELSAIGSTQKDQWQVKYSKLKASQEQKKAWNKIRLEKKRAEEERKALLIAVDGLIT